MQTENKQFAYRLVHNFKYKLRDIEIQMVCPLKYSYMLARSVLNDDIKTSNADADNLGYNHAALKEAVPSSGMYNKIKMQ